jgi:hypothetical protein
MGAIKNGFRQIPKNIEIDGKLYHLEDVLKHPKTGNAFKIKEIQDKGFVVLTSESPFPIMIDKKAYISFGNLNEYTL